MAKNYKGSWQDALLDSGPATARKRLTGVTGAGALGEDMAVAVDLGVESKGVAVFMTDDVPAGSLWVRYGESGDYCEITADAKVDQFEGACDTVYFYGAGLAYLIKVDY